jgi:hypothetical protein
MWLILAALILAAGSYVGYAVGTEGHVRVGICRELLAGHTAGRQGVISSVWWAPFPTLATLPLVFLLPSGDALLACQLLSALAGAGAILLLEQALRKWNAGRWRRLLVAGMALNPAFLVACWTGASAPLLVGLLVLSLYSLTTWVRARRLRDLIWFGLGSAFLLGSSFEMSGWVLAGVLVLVVEEWRRRVVRQEKGAVLIVAFLPLAYTLALWVLMCWLIMGDPVYAARSLFGRGPGPGSGLVLSDTLWWSYIGLAVLATLTLAAAIRRHDRSGVCLAVLGLALPGAAGLLAWRDRLWETAPLLTSLLPAAALAVGYWLVGGAGPLSVCPTGTGDHGDPRRTTTGTPDGRARPAPVVWLAAALPLALGWLPALARPAPRAVAAPAPLESSWLPQLEHHVLQRSKFAKVFVCGFEGFALLRDTSSTVFVRSLDFNFDKAKRDYYGQVLYLLVRRPEQRNAMDSIHWKYRHIYVQGGQETLYDSDWGDWRLFELIQVAAR